MEFPSRHVIPAAAAPGIVLTECPLGDESPSTIKRACASAA